MLAAGSSIEADYEKTVTISEPFTTEQLQYGYYVMVSTRAGVAQSGYTVFTLNQDTVAIYEKNVGLPNISKTVNDENGAPKTGIAADFNATLDYTITIKAAAGTDEYVVSDTMSEKITFQRTLTVKGPKLGVVTTLVEGTDYTVSNVSDDGFKITFVPAYRATLQDNDAITIAYQGKLDKADAIADAFVNAAKLEYTGKDGQRTSHTVRASVYSGMIEFIKLDNKTDQNLAGAEFKLKKGDLYAKLEAFGSSTINFKFIEWVTEADQASVITTTDSTSNISIRGLSAGDYTLVETKIPDGYIGSNDTPIKVQALSVDENGNVIAALTNGMATIYNAPGTELPGTGGIGTTIFYTAGGLLVLGAVVLFIVKRRKTA